jgi:type 1 fimbria pilin
MTSNRRWILVGITVLLAAGLAGAVQAEGGEKVTLQGEILDMACYVSRGATGAEHAKCAKACVKGGQPMGILAKDGTVYLLYASHEDGSAFNETKEFAGAQVELTGMVASKSGIKGIEVQSVKAL